MSEATDYYEGYGFKLCLVPTGIDDYQRVYLLDTTRGDNMMRDPIFIVKPMDEHDARDAAELARRVILAIHGAG